MILKCTIIAPTILKTKGQHLPDKATEKEKQGKGKEYEKLGNVYGWL